MIKLISLDVDGTLLDNQGNLSQDNQDAIQAAKKRGVHIIINSGKPLSALNRLFNMLELDDPVITLTGGLVLKKDAQKGWISLANFPIPTSSFLPIYQAIKHSRVTTFFFTQHHSYVHHIKQNPLYLHDFEENLKRNTVYEYSLVSKSPLSNYEKLDLPVYKIMFYSDVAEEIEEIYRVLDSIKYPGLRVEGSSRDTVDVHMAKTGKKQAVELICQHYRIQRDEVMALGDHESDLDLIKWAGVGAIMANAKIYLKTIAPRIAPSNDCNGVAKMIQSYAL